MIKLVALVRRKAGMDPADFRDCRLDVHAPLAAAIPGMRSDRINIARAPADMPAAPCDGSADIRFDDRAAMAAGHVSAQGAIAGDDTAQFAERVEFPVTEEHVIPPAGAAR